jgi:hypothetical protein
MQYPLLSGRAGDRKSTAVGFPLLAAGVVLATLFAILIWRGTSARLIPTEVSTHAVVPTLITSPVAAAPAEDIAFHVAGAKRQLLTAHEQLVRMQRLVGALIPELTRSELPVERRKAESAVSTCETAKQAIEQALEELQAAMISKEQH